MSAANPFVHPQSSMVNILDCVHCGLCLSACPTYLELGTETDSPRGRIYLMRGLEEKSISLSPDVVRHLDLCLGCRACETACPSGVRYGELIESARVAVESQHQRSPSDRFKRRMIELVFPRPAVLRTFLWPLRLLELLGILPWVRRIVPLARLLPPLRSWSQPARIVAAHGRETQRVGLLSGCVAQVLFAETNRATARVLARNGCTVVTPRQQGCCGALYLHAGNREAARACARRNIDAFGADLQTIVVTAAGCGAAMKEYAALLADDPAYAERAQGFAQRVRDVTELLDALPLQPPPDIGPMRVTYHDACHLAHGQGVREAPRRLLRRIPGVELVELPESDLCCGSAGSYNLTEPEMARRLGERKAENIAATAAHCVAAANPGCALQIRAALLRAGMSADVRHPVELLDLAYRRAE
ncbi:MAG: glycolate oxidase subunit GlcF [Deltaproteobacteria bacterium]|nr:glycolate oxidase subunit GlcF [Deltaproteobacteria bacterium]